MKKINIKSVSFLVIGLAVLAFFSCNENTVKENLTVKKGLNYYPLEIGKYIVYEVDSIIYHSGSADCEFVRDTSHFYLKEEVVDICVDNTGEEMFVLERYIRYDQNDPWQVADVWSVQKTETQVERVEENLRFIKMVFPVSEGISWNGNSYFKDTIVALGGETIEFYTHWSSEYEYDLVDAQEEFNGVAYDSVTTIIQSEASDNKVNHRYAIEKYARNIGLVYKELKVLDTQCCSHFPELGPCDGIPWEEKAERGLIYRQVIIDHN